MKEHITELAHTPVYAEELSAFCLEAMRRCDMREGDARRVADVLVTTDTWGIFSHGSKQLRPLLEMRFDRVDLKAVPEVMAEGPGWAIMDGRRALAPVTSCKAMEVAIAKARTAGCAYVGVRNSNHFGAAAYYANMAVKADMIGLAMTNTNPLVTVPGSRFAVMGTNPLSYAVPAGQEPPIFLDVATSVVAASKVITARALGRKIPENWLVDGDGVPTTDPSHYPESGALLPMAGHKGYGLALLIEILAAALTGAQVLDEVKLWLEKHPEPLSQGHAFMVINIGAMIPVAAFKARVDEIIRSIKGAPKAQGAERIYLPGEMEWEKRAKALAHGMVLPPDVIQRLAGLAADLGMDLRTLLRSKGMK